MSGQMRQGFRDIASYQGDLVAMLKGPSNPRSNSFWVLGTTLFIVVVWAKLLKCAFGAQVDLVAMPEGPENPHGNGFWAQERRC